MGSQHRPYLLGVDVINRELLQGCRHSVSIPSEQLSHHLPDVTEGDGHTQQQGHRGYQVHLGNGLRLLERQRRNRKFRKNTARKILMQAIEYNWEDAPVQRVTWQSHEWENAGEDRGTAPQ